MKLTAGTHSWQHRTHTLGAGQRLAMVKLYVAGVPEPELAKRFGVHPDYIRVAARRLGFSRNRPDAIPLTTEHVRVWRSKGGLIKAAGC